MGRTVRSPVLLSAALAGAATLLIAFAPGVKFAYWAPSLHAALESAVAIFSALVAYFLAIRFAHSRRLRDLWLVGGLGVLAATNLLFSAVPALAGASCAAPFPWLRIAGTLLGAFLLVGAAHMPDRQLRNPQRRARTVLGALAVLFVVVSVGTALLGAQSPLGPNPAASDVPHIRTWDLFAVLQLVAMSAFATAALGFARRPNAAADALLIGLAAGSMISAFARLQYVLFPAPASGWVFSRDILRLAFYLVLLAAALRDLRAHQNRVAAEAAVEERRRVARDIHDGIAQELAFISMQSRLLADRSGDRAFDHIADAADHALHESRGAIASLLCPAEASLDTAVAEVAQHLTSRCGVALRLDLDPRAELPAHAREQLLRVLREAVWNALHHGHATAISVELTCAGGVRLRVSDNGVGFDVDAPFENGRGVGLVAMSERARALGGELRLRTSPGAGTDLALVLPADGPAVGL
jgi:signal transduction histidine kinase